MIDYYLDDEGPGTFRLFDLLRRQLGADFGEELSRGGNGFLREGDRMVFRMDVPGARPDDLDVMVHGRTITIRGERSDDTPRGYQVLRKERPVYRVSRTMTVPPGAKTENIDVSLRNGVLALSFEVSPDVGPRKIELNRDESQQTKEVR